MAVDGLQPENDELRRRLAEAEDALAAIRGGDVDAIVMESATGAQIFSLAGAETVYRLAVETMAEAFINTTPEGTILFCNARFGEFVGTPIEELLGRDITDFVTPEDSGDFRELLQACAERPVKQRVSFQGAEGTCRPTLLTGRAMTQGGDISLCLVASDLSELESSAHQIERLREKQRELEDSRMLQTAAAKENAQLYALRTRQMQYAEALNRINDAIHTTLDPDEILSRAATELREALEADAAGVQMLRDGRWHVTHVSGLPAPPDSASVAVEPSSGLLELLRSRTPVVSLDVANDSRVEMRLISRFGAKAVVAVPLVIRGEVLGLVFVSWIERSANLSDEAIDFARKAAADLSLALENARLFESEREQARLNRSMLEIHKELASSLDIDRTLPEVLEKASVTLGATGATLMGLAEGGWCVRYAVGFAAPVLGVGEVYDHQQTPVLNKVLETREPVIVNDVEQEAGVDHDLAAGMGCRAFASYPLVTRGGVTGVIGVQFDEPHQLSAQASNYLRRLAYAVSVNEESSRLYKAEHEIADRLQEALLALPEKVQGVEFAHAYHSATEAARVGGDFYDAFELAGDHVGLIIGDVAGKGLDAAVLTSMVKNTIRAHANEPGKTPRQVIELTNEVMYRATVMGAFVTVFFGILDCCTGRLVYSNAGHTTAAIVQSNGQVGKLSVTGPILGAFEDVRYAEAEANLGFDELLFLYTDGLTEAREQGRLFGEERVFELLAASKGQSPSEIVEGAIKAVLAFSEGHLPDDMAILAVRRSGCAAESPH